MIEELLNRNKLNEVPLTATQNASDFESRVVKLNEPLRLKDHTTGWSTCAGRPVN